MSSNVPSPSLPFAPSAAITNNKVALTVLPPPSPVSPPSDRPAGVSNLFRESQKKLLSDSPSMDIHLLRGRGGAGCDWLGFVLMILVHLIMWIILLTVMRMMISPPLPFIMLFKLPDQRLGIRRLPLTASTSHTFIRSRLIVSISPGPSTCVYKRQYAMIRRQLSKATIVQLLCNRCIKEEVHVD
jgi:hypothetical protein